jgi:hypothetical protein
MKRKGRMPTIADLVEDQPLDHAGQQQRREWCRAEDGADDFLAAGHQAAASA